MALVIFAKLREIGLLTEDPIGYDAEGNVVGNAQTKCVLLLLQDKDYAGNDSLPDYDLPPPLIIIQHRQGNVAQINLVNRFLTGCQKPLASPINRTFSHRDDEGSGIFKELKSIVACVASIDRKRVLGTLESHFVADHYIQVMDELKARIILDELSPDINGLPTRIGELESQIPGRWRVGDTVEKWYANMMQELTVCLDEHER